LFGNTQTAAKNVGKPKRKRPSCVGPGLFRSCCPNLAATYHVVAQRCLGALARALDSSMLVSSKGGDIPQPSLMATLHGWHLLPVVASVRSMLPPSPIRTRYVALGNYDSDVSRMSRLAVISEGGSNMGYFWALGSNDTLQQQCMTLPRPVAKATATCRDRGT
jgi:hypothetical protein